MLLKFRLFSFLSRNTLSRKYDVGSLFTWANYADTTIKPCIIEVSLPKANHNPGLSPSLIDRSQWIFFQHWSHIVNLLVVYFCLTT